MTYRQEHSSNDGERRAPARDTADSEAVAVLAAGAGAVVCAGGVRLHRQTHRGPVRQILPRGLRPSTR
ncbi:MAG: hypothetical protein ACK56F_20790, partial [bacterium]